MSDTSVTVKVVIAGYPKESETLTYESHLIECEPTAPLTAIIDDVRTDLQGFVVKAIEFKS